MKVTVSYNNFARGRVDHDMNGRFDLPIYKSSLDLCNNFITNFKGNAIYRAGFESMFLFEDSVFVEFKFKNDQQYLCVFFLNKIRFLTFANDGTFGFVESSPSVILEVTTPYTLDEARVMQFTQKDDVMYVTHQSHEPHKLVRTSATNFTFNVFARKLDPFVLTNDSTTTITAISKATNAVVTVSGHPYSAGDRVTFAGISGMTELNTWTARVVADLGANTFSIDVDTTDFTTYSSSGTAALVLTGDFPKNCLFYKSRLYYGATPTKITTIFASEEALFDEFALTPVDDNSALILTLTNISQEIEWLAAGSNSLIVGTSDGIVVVNGSGVGNSITAENVASDITGAPPCNSSIPFTKDGLIFYVSLDGRNLYYFNFDLLSETFQAQDANFIAYDVTEGGMGKIRHKRDRNDLITAIGGNGDIMSCNFNIKENIIGWHNHISNNDTFVDQAVITDNDGKPQFFVLSLRSGTYYIERQGELIEFKKRVNFFSADAGETDLNILQTAKQADDDAYTRFIAEQLKSVIYLDNSQIASNLQSNSITYDSGAGTITATSPVFASGDVNKHIVYKTDTGYESGRFLITAFTSTTVVEVDVLQTPTVNTFTDWYLSFRTLTGLSQYNGTTISIVTDGGFLNDFAVSGGEVDLGNFNTTHAVVGYRYKGIIKSFALGFQIGAENTQATITAITEFALRFVSSSSGRCGSSLYKTEPIQELTQDDLNYLPPLPIDGTKSVFYSDDGEQDKEFFIVQDEPLPMTLTNVMLKAYYAVRT